MPWGGYGKQIFRFLQSITNVREGQPAALRDEEHHGPLRDMEAGASDSATPEVRTVVILASTVRGDYNKFTMVNLANLSYGSVAMYSVHAVF